MKNMKNIQNTLGAMAIFAGTLAGSTFAQETQKAQTTTQNAVATAVGDTTNKSGVTQVSLTTEKKAVLSPEEQKKLEEQKKKAFEAALKVDVKKLEFPKDVERVNELLKIFEIDYKVDKEKKISFIIATKKVNNFILDENTKRLEEEGNKYREEGRIARANTEKNMEELRKKATELEIRIANSKK